ncbi:hypothetical protein CRYUN_Cryun31cG0128700 [Craigia yunnanensis]
MAVQATLLTATPFLYTAISRPMVPLLKIGWNGCFAYSTNSSRVASFQPRSITNSNHQEIVRPLGNFPPDIWGDHFMTLSFDNSEFESCSRQVEVLKEMVKDMLVASTDDPIENMFLINSLCRLGVSYHFESEIEKQLSHLFITLGEVIDNYKDYNLHTIAIIFQVFRSHGYKIPCDVFNKFKNGDGKFKETVVSDMKGMISLYEASHFRINGELILDEALAFTTLHLESSLANQASPHHAEYIVNALCRPYHKGVPRLEARQYISFYERDESRNDVLLEFAKCDFNWIQMLLQQELSHLCGWWKESDIESRFPYARHRNVEAFFLAVGIYFEPCYARARNIYAKLTLIIGLLDDTYDAYGTYEELQYFTDAMQRFDMSVMDKLPADYLKLLYETILDVHDEAQQKVSEEGRSYSVSYTKNEFKKLVVTYLAQARWVHEGYLPTFDEYLEIALKSSAAIVSVSLALIGMEEADENAYQWLINNDNKIHKALNILTRLYDDIMTNEDEEKRGLVCGTNCYMKQYGVTRKEAIEAYQERIEDAWKELNEGYLRPTPVPIQILKRAVNFARLMDVAYKHDDGLGKPEISLQDYIAKLLIHPLPL